MTRYSATATASGHRANKRGHAGESALAAEAEQNLSEQESLAKDFTRIVAFHSLPGAISR
jgi:hypothetical protein